MPRKLSPEIVEALRSPTNGITGRHASLIVFDDYEGLERRIFAAVLKQAQEEWKMEIDKKTTHVVGVLFADDNGNWKGATYFYFAERSLYLNVNDLIVIYVNSPYYGNGYKVAKVITIVEDDYRASKWVIDKVDKSSEAKRIQKAAEHAALELVQKRLRVQLSEEVRKAKEHIDYVALNKVNPNIQKVLKEMEALGMEIPGK